MVTLNIDITRHGQFLWLIRDLKEKFCLTASILHKRLVNNLGEVFRTVNITAREESEDTALSWQRLKSGQVAEAEMEKGLGA